NPDHMRANAELDFEISDADMTTLKQMHGMDYGDADIFPVFGGKMKG
ncbi:aldo/keto reductase, partial [Pediococcus acidilactici]